MNKLQDIKNFDEWLESVVKISNSNLEKLFASLSDVPSELLEVMKYASLGPGKRLRAALVYATSEIYLKDIDETERDYLSHIVSAIELIHAYSLVHDDLPCMDDDDLRRGRPTCHIKYGEAMALLAADALQPLAHEHLLSTSIEAEIKVNCSLELLKATGASGMVGGQVIDILNVSNLLKIEDLKDMHGRKTGALIKSCLTMVIALFRDKNGFSESLNKYAEHIGIAYQVVDDILDVTQDSDTLGKTAGKDEQNNKPTYVTILGLSKAHDYATELYEKAIEALASIPNSDRLKDLAHYIILRNF